MDWVAPFRCGPCGHLADTIPALLQHWRETKCWRGPSEKALFLPSETGTVAIEPVRIPPRPALEVEAFMASEGITIREGDER